MNSIKKFILGIFGLFAVLILPIGVSAKTLPVASPSPTPSPAPTVIDSYQLFYPVSHGRVMGDTLYALKSIKESLREIIIFGAAKKAEYNITLSEKRLVEAEYLFNAKKDYPNAQKSLMAAKEKMEKTVDLIGKSGDSGAASVKMKLGVSLDKQRQLLNYLATLVPEEQGNVIAAYEDYLSSVLANLQK